MNEPVSDCLACAVRQFTEGTPEVWNPQEEGETISGVVLNTGQQRSRFGGTTPFVDLWDGAMGRTRVAGRGACLDLALTRQAPKVGDRVSVVYQGRKRIEGGLHSGRDYKVFQVTVERGHH